MSLLKNVTINAARAFGAGALCVAITVSAHAETLLIKNATIHTLSARGTLQDSDLLIENGRIKTIGKNLQAAGVDRTIDATGKVITPGIMGVNNQIGVLEINAIDGTVDGGTEDEKFGASFNLVEAFNPHSTVVPHNRAQGVTRTLLAPSRGNNVVAGQGSIVSLSGEFHPVIKNNAAVYAAYGEGSTSLGGGSRTVVLAKLANALSEAREFAANDAAIASGDWRELENSPNDLRALQSVLSGDAPMVVSANRASDIVALLRFAQRENIRLVISGAAEAWMVADQLAKAGVPVVLDPINNIPGSFESLGRRLENAAMLHKAGVKLVFTGPGFLATHNAFLARQGAGNAVAYGLPHLEGLKAIISNPAEVFGGADDYGQIRPGFAAELVVWDGDPLEVTTEVEQVVLDGKLVDRTSRASRLRDRYMNVGKESNTPYIK